ncbi:MAG: CARDB domain-containing protein [Lapillicoccus sp.]
MILRSYLSRSSVAVLSAAVLVTGAAGAVPRADAATPASGSVSDSSRSVSWTGGPYVTPNVTGVAGPVTCGPGLCDDFALHVGTSAGYGDTHQLTITVSWPLAAADFDIYLLDSAGTEVTSAASSSDPEVMITAPTSGDYTVRVVPFAPLGQSFTATAALTDKAVNPPPSTATPPTYSQYGAPEAYRRSHDAGEPSIGSNHKTNAAFYQALFETYRATWDDSVSPSAVSWSNVTANAATGCPVGSTTTLDPIGFTDPKTGRVFESQLAGKTSLMCYSDDEGKTWSASQGGGLNSGVDHQTVGGGPYPAGALGPLPTSSYPNAVYYCSQDIADASCAASHDGGVTFGAAVPIYSLLDCGGLHGHVKVAPDGTVYVPNKGCGGNQAVAVSEDGGLTWSVRKNPASTAGGSDPSVGIGANGTVYVGYQAADGTARAAVSHDKGRTWSNDQNVGVPFGINNTVFPAVVAGDDDRASFAFIGTPTAGNYQDAANFKGVWHLYVSTTYDSGKSWVTVDTTPSDPVQRGSICTGGTTCGQDRNLLDFMDATVDRTGRVLVGYADGCTGACATGGAENFDAYATIARQQGGNTLYAAYDALPDLTPTSLSAAKVKNAYTVTAIMANVGAATARGATLRLLVDGVVRSTSTAADLAAGTSRTVTFSGVALSKGTHTLTVVADPANTIRESSESNNRRSITQRA